MTRSLESGVGLSPSVGGGVGHVPVAPILSSDGQTLYICNRFENTVSVRDAATLSELDRIEVGREPVGLVLSPDDSTLYVANLVPAMASTSRRVASTVSVVDTATRKELNQILLPNGSNAVRGICISPDGKYVYVTHLIARYTLDGATNR